MNDIVAELNKKISDLTAENNYLKMILKDQGIEINILKKKKIDNSTKNLLKERRKVIIYTDGSCSGNPGPGGWGAIISCKSKGETIYKEVGGFSPTDTTNNVMELSAVIGALKVLTIPCDIIVYSDSQYVVNIINEKWGAKKNKELWDKFFNLKKDNNHIITAKWVRGHNGDPMNEKVDAIATQQTELSRQYISRKVKI